MNRKMLRKRLGAFLLAACVLMGMVLGGCGEKPEDEVLLESSITELTQVFASSEDGGKESDAESGTEEERTQRPVWEDESTIVLSEDGADLFHSIEGWDFSLEKSTDAWIDLSVDAYGRFTGYSERYDRNDSGEGYERGTYYYCNYEGIFGDVVKTSEFTYEVTVADLICEEQAGKAEISDQLRRLSSDAFGIAKADKLEIYLPGARIEGLPKGFQDSIPDDAFGTYVLSDYYVDVPLELPFCGIYNPKENVGLCSENVSGKNLIYFTNKGNFPGLKNKSLTIDEAQGTYSCFDEQEQGRCGVFNLCFKPGKNYDRYHDAEEFVQLCVSQVTANVDFEEVYFLEARDGMTSPNLLYVNGDETFYAGWSAGSKGSERDYYARMLQRGEYAYIYGYWTTDEDEYFYGVAGSFFLSSLTFTGNPKKISSADPDHAVRKAYGIVVRNGADPTSILVDEIQWSIENYESGVGSYWVLTGDDGNYKTFQLSESCSIYLLQPEEGRLWSWQSKSAFHEKLKKEGRFYLMELYLDENDQVTFLFEEDRT